MAFFGLFSLFPLMLVLIATGTSILDDPLAKEQILEMIMNVFPFSLKIVEENIQKVLNIRGTVQFFGLLTLAWSATGAFTALTRNINRAWPNATRRNFLINRLMAFLMLGVILVVILTLLLSNTIINILPIDTNGVAILMNSLRYFSRFMVWLVTYLTLLWLYRWIPNTDVTWSEAAWGSLFASLGTVIVTTGFAWSISTGFSNYSLVYGSLGAILALMFWIYLISVIVLFGAHLSSSVAYYDRISKEKMLESLDFKSKPGKNQ